jgi:aryl-alcohol dehydrogenase-like predicted oxidoreductase
MKLRPLGSTGVQVFPINLGGNVFGWTADREASFAVLDAYRAAGGNFVDTADVYSKWAPGHRGGESEETLGAWLRDRGRRDETIVATKVGMGGPELEAGLTAAQIRTACEGSLRRLGVERIDLYYAHKDDEATPLEESLQAFDDLVRAGKVRWIGASNYAAPRLHAALELQEANGLARFVVFQPRYNLVARADFEGPLADLCRERGLAACTYHALASGFLTGKYGGGAQVASPRAKGVQKFLDDPRAMAVLAALREVAEGSGASMAQVALAWLLQRPEVTTPIASATSVAQLRELLGAVDLRLSADAVAALDRASAA